MDKRWSITEKGITYANRLIDSFDSGRDLSSSQLLRESILNDIVRDEFVTVDGLKELAKSYYPIHSEDEFWAEIAWLARQGYIGQYEEVHRESNLVKNQITYLPELKLTQVDRFSKFHGSDGRSRGRTGTEGGKMEYHPEELTDEEMN